MYGVGSAGRLGQTAFSWLFRFRHLLDLYAHNYSAIMSQVIQMIYTCDNCYFKFDRATQPEQCPDCGKYAVREATEAEKQEYEELLKEFQDQ